MLLLYSPCFQTQKGNTTQSKRKWWHLGGFSFSKEKSIFCFLNLATCSTEKNWLNAEWAERAQRCEPTTHLQRTEGKLEKSFGRFKQSVQGLERWHRRSKCGLLFQNVVTNTHHRWFANTCSSSSQGSKASAFSGCTHTHVHIFII